MRIISAGAPIRIDSMHFSVDDPSVYYEEAREKAVVDTKVKADHLAELGGLLLVSQLTSLRVSILFRLSTKAYMDMQEEHRYQLQLPHRHQSALERRR